MQRVFLGEDITFKISYSDGSGNLVDPPEVTFTVYRVVSIPTFGPLQYDGGNGDVVRLSEGVYQATIRTHPHMMPGVYTAQWEALLPDTASVAGVAEVEGTDTYFYQDSTMSGVTTDVGGGQIAKFSRVEFQVDERLQDMSGQLDPPTIHGLMRPSPRFNDMGFGTTSQLFIVGHCSGLTINEPHQIHSMQDTINIIGANSYSPMVRYIMEAHNAGCRDIWIMPSAPEHEFIPWDPSNPAERFTPRPEFGNRNFYEQYKIRYDETMAVLAEWEYPDIVVAPDAPLYNTGGVDFLTPLVESCATGFSETGRFRFGFIGTLIGTEFSQADIDAMITDPRLDSYGSSGKTICVVHGEGTIKAPNIGTAYSHSVINIAAATTTRLPVQRGLAYVNLPGVINPIRQELSKDQVKALANAKINSLIRPPRARRGAPYESVIATDNLLAMEGSDFWAMPQMKLVQDVIKDLRALANRKIGTIQYQVFREEVMNYLRSLVLDGVIRDYSVEIRRNMIDFNAIEVEVVLTPFTGIREIYFTVEVGAGQVVDNVFRNTV